MTALFLFWLLPGASAPPAEPAPTQVSSGVLVGQVLSDATGLPVPEASARLVDAAAPPRPVDLDGRFGLTAAPGLHLVAAEKDGFTTVERRATSVAGQGTAVLDARLTPLATPAVIGASGGTASAAGVTVTVSPGTVSAPTGFIVTALSPQGLPNVLPLGFAPVLAFDFRAGGGSPAGPFTARLGGLPAATALHLVEYRSSEHAWQLTEASLTVGAGEAAVTLPGLGAYAVVTIDDDGPALPGPGAPLAGSDPAPLPAGLTGAAAVEPLQVPASGATARGLLTAASPVNLPSGTLMQARLT
jgi:hypothetical protein